MSRQPVCLRFVVLVVYFIYRMSIILPFSAGLGMGTNNFAQLLSLKALLTLALEHEIHTLEIFGDYQLVINLVLGKYKIKNLQLT